MRSATLLVVVGLLVPAGLTASGQDPSSKSGRGDTSQNSLDWAGVYEGVVPCADCPGIETSLTIRQDHTYVLRMRYLGREEQARERRGTFTWNQQGNQIQLQGVADRPGRYLVGENQLVQLDLRGNRITGNLADRYVLRKSGDAAPGQGPGQVPAALVTPKVWRLTELMGKPVTAPKGNRVPELTFQRDGRVTGYSGCNSLTGTFSVTGTTQLRFGPIAATRKACLESTVEAEFLKMLGSVDNFTIAGRTLSLNRARMAPLARFQAGG